MELARWAVYTVLLAMTPILMRFLIAILATAPAQIRWLSESDVAIFGLILVITNISTLENATNIEATWKTKHIGFSLLLTAMFAALFAITCFQELQQGVFERSRVLGATLVLSLGSVLYSYAIWDRIAVTSVGMEPHDG
jgi:hypothetical protein